MNRSHTERRVSENSSAREHAIPPALAFRRIRTPPRRNQIEIFDKNRITGRSDPGCRTSP